MTHRFAVFTPEENSAMEQAFAAAWNDLVQSGSELAAPAHEDATREALVLEIIAMMQGGTRTVDNLRDGALAALALPSERKQA